MVKHNKINTSSSGVVANDTSNGIQIHVKKNLLLWSLVALVTLAFVAYISSYLTKRYIEKQVINIGADSYKDLRELLKKSCFGAVYFSEYPPAPQPIKEQTNTEGHATGQQTTELLVPQVVPLVPALTQGYNQATSNFLIYLCENVSNSNCITDQPMPLPSSFALNNVTILRNKDLNANYGYIFFDEQSNITYLIWSGTASPQMWYEDSKTYSVQVPYLQSTTAPIKIHSGFAEIYSGIRNQLRTALLQNYLPRSIGIIVSGHSLGGAMAQLSAFDLFGEPSVGGNDVFVNSAEHIDKQNIGLPVAVYTFASPRCGNLGFASAYIASPRIAHSSFRVFNTEDIVPTSPPSGTVDQYTHTGTPIPFTLNMGNVSQNHIQSYIVITTN